MSRWGDALDQVHDELFGCYPISELEDLMLWGCLSADETVRLPDDPYETALLVYERMIVQPQRMVARALRRYELQP